MKQVMALLGQRLHHKVHNKVDTLLPYPEVGFSIQVFQERKNNFVNQVFFMRISVAQTDIGYVSQGHDFD
jgi:hypothetical protein